MWRFVVICFALMALAFYELSGGSDYEPAPNSLQAQAKLPKQERIGYRAEESVAPEPNSESLAEVEAGLGQLASQQSETQPFSVTLAVAQSDAISILEVEEKDSALQVLEGEEIAPTPSIDAAVAIALGEVTFDESQIRLVKDALIDVRSGPGLSFERITSIPQGTKVAVLENPGHGWLNVQVIDQFQTGWVAEWLLKRPE